MCIPVPPQRVGIILEEACSEDTPCQKTSRCLGVKEQGPRSQAGGLVSILHRCCRLQVVREQRAGNAAGGALQSPVHHRDGCRVKPRCHLHREGRATSKPELSERAREQCVIVFERLLSWHELYVA